MTSTGSIISRSTGRSCLSGIANLTVGASCKINPQRALQPLRLGSFFHDRFHPSTIALAQGHCLFAWLGQRFFESNSFSPFLNPVGERRIFDSHVVSKLRAAATASFPLVE